MRNLILTKDCTYGLDFSMRGSGPAAMDLARFLTRLPPASGDAGGTGQATELDDQDLDAFFAGYGTDMRADPVYLHCLCVQIVRDWIGLPAQRVNRSPSQQARLEARTEMLAGLQNKGL